MMLGGRYQHLWVECLSPGKREVSSRLDRSAAKTPRARPRKSSAKPKVDSTRGLTAVDPTRSGPSKLAGIAAIRRSPTGGALGTRTMQMLAPCAIVRVNPQGWV